MNYQGSCLCRKVSYEIEGELGPLICCHCQNCRKVNGTAFATSSPIAKSQFCLRSGQETLKEYESSPGIYRVFCGNCASPIFSRRDATPDLLRLRVGTLDTKIDSRPSMHIFVSEKAEWYEICDEAPQFETLQAN